MFKKIPKQFFPNYVQQEKGQGLVEYALILVLVAIVVIAILLTLGPAVAQVYCKIANSLQAGSCVTGGVIVSVSAVGAGSNVSVSVTVSQSSNVTISASSGSIGTPTKPCNTSCSFAITGAAANGTVTATAAAGGTMSANW